MASEPTATGSSNETPRRPPKSVPFISLYRPPPGQPPNTTDERCFIYCTQSALHRAQNKPPICYSVCLRRIFPFEIEVLQHDVPLPPEGQAHSPNPDQSVPASSSYTSPKTGNASTPQQPHPPPHPQETRVWNPGFYIWTSSSARATRDKIDMMAMDLSKQYLWSQRRDEWIQKRQAALTAHARTIVDKNARIRLDDGIEITKDGQIDGPWSHSFLHPLSSSLIKSCLLSPVQSLLDPISTLLAPTSHALLHFRNALDNGSLHHLGTRAWEKAWSPEPMMLAMRVVKRVWKKEGGEGEGEGEGDMDG
ncbi:hypothetical protein V8B97DRAFT_1962964 [Scleroderma yunnanense]